MVISGKELAAACKAKMAEQVKTFPEKYGRLPHLVVVLVGEDAGSVSYVTGKTKAADEVGILNTTIRKPADISEEELLKIIDDLNADDTGDGILIQLPLPKHIDSDKVIARIRQEKDVDGFHPFNVAALWQKQPCVLPCTKAYSLSRFTVESSTTRNVVGLSMGTVMRRKDWKLLAPSMLAASYRSGEMLLMPPT